MAWAEPVYSRSRVDAAGATLADARATAEDRELALTVINNWRSSHSFPLNTLHMNLRKLAAQSDDDPTVAQRIKRLPSIRHKLERFDGMKLSRMQDIGGCRAVVSSGTAVDAMVAYYSSKSRMKHKLLRSDNYISDPKSSGYRGVHLVYAYNSDRRTNWNGLRIEIQIRSRLQHAWATAVETVGTFTQQVLKSSWGEEDWLRFFALMSSSMALREGGPLVPETPTEPGALTAELRSFAEKLDVIDRLTVYGSALQLIDEEAIPKGSIFLLELNIPAKSLVARSYANASVAAEEYEAIERAIEDEPGKDVVLVSVDSLSSLRRAYPNYFLDTTEFISAVREAIA